MLRSALSFIQSRMMAITHTPLVEPSKQPLIIIFGATGTGKSQLAVDLARHFNGEIINGDAMQLYAGLPIVTNKITPAEQMGIPHHLLGCIPLEETWRVGIWRREALRIVDEIRSRGRLPIVVGGTHYYLQSLLGGDPKLLDSQAVANDDDSDSASETATASSKELTPQQIEERWPILKESGERMLEELKKVDPEIAQRWHPNDKRKIQRSLQIWLTTGRRVSDIYAEQKTRSGSQNSSSDEAQVRHESPFSTLLFWVHAQDQVLKNRLNSRVEKMIQAGLLGEIKSLNAFLQDQESLGAIVDRTRGIWVSIGWKEFEPYLRIMKIISATDTEIDDALTNSIEQTQVATRRYARHQVRWIRHQILPVTAKDSRKLFLLDSSKLDRFEEDVSRRAIDITSSWLQGQLLPDPAQVSELAKEFLGQEEKVDSLVKRTCETCGVITVTDTQWRTHLQSRKHRGTLKRRAKNKQRDDYLRNQEKATGRSCSIGTDLK